MATVYKQKDRPNWMIAWFDGTGKRRVRSSGTTDRRTAEAIAARLEGTATKEREGLVDPRDEKLKRGARTPILELVNEFCERLRDKGDCGKHVGDRRGQLARLIAAMRIERATEISVARAQAALSSLKASRGIALRTLDRHVRAIKGLSRYLAREGLLAFDPLVSLDGFNAATDRRRERRALSDEDIARLIAAAENGRVVRGLSGPDRSMLYRLALGTGFRASELGSLTRGSFDLDDDPPTITVKAGYAKNRRNARQPIRRDLADLLRPWISRKGTPAARAFDVKSLEMRTAAMMRTDLAAAGIPYIDADGKFADFHSLRHTFVSALVRSGASVKQAQVLARHSTPMLTLAVYSHVATEELVGALERMPGNSRVR